MSERNGPQRSVFQLSHLMLKAMPWMLGAFIATQASCSFAQFFVNNRQDVVSLYLFEGLDEASHRARMESRSELRLTHIAEIVVLEEVQQEKLRLAIRADLNRFYRCVAAVREKTKDLNIEKQNDMQKAWEIVGPLQQRVSAGLIEEGSLFEKVLDASLSDDQNELYEKDRAARKNARFESIIRMTIADMELSIPLLAKQRTALMDALMQYGPPKSIPKGYEPFLGFIILDKLDATVVSEILDEPQRKAFKQFQQQGRQYAAAVKW